MADVGAAGPADTGANTAVACSAAVAATAAAGGLSPDVGTMVEAAQASLETAGDAEAWASLIDAQWAATIDRCRNVAKVLEAKLAAGGGGGGGGGGAGGGTMQSMMAAVRAGPGASTAAASRSGTPAASGGTAQHARVAAAAQPPPRGCTLAARSEAPTTSTHLSGRSHRSASFNIHANVTMYEWAQLCQNI
eukprot:364533-Chlamydomonas_euryale.AAC.8